MRFGPVEFAIARAMGMPTITGGQLVDGAGNPVTVATASPSVVNIAALRAYNNPALTSIYVNGYTSAYDGGEGPFRVDASDTTSADNGGTIIVDALGRRWKRVDQLLVTPQQFGAIPDEISGGSFDNAPALTATFQWALAQNTGVTVDLQSFTYSCETPPYLGIPSTTATPNQAQPITIRGSSAWRQAGKKGARIKVKATSIGQHASILRIDATQQIAWLSLENFTLEAAQISATVSAQTPSSNTIVITGGDAKGFVTGTPVFFTGGGGGTEVSRAGNAFYFLYKVAGTDTYQLATTPANAQAGTTIALTTAWTGSTTVTATQGGSVAGLLFDGTRNTAPRLYGIHVKYADNSFQIQAVGDSANGEFPYFEKCFGYFCKRYFYMTGNASTGQALESFFVDCGANPRLQDAVAVFEYGGDPSRGYGVHTENMNVSVVPIPANAGEYRPRISFVKDNGTSDSNVFVGGRVENITTLYEGANDSYQSRTRFTGITFASIASTADNPFVYLTGTGIPGAGSLVTADHCFFYAPSSNWAKTNCLYNFAFTTTSTSSFLFERCTFNFNRRLLTQGTTSSSIEFVDCTQQYGNLAGATVTIKKFSEKICGHTLHPLSARGGQNTINSYPGQPSNLLIYPNFGNATGATITAPSPWVHTGQPAFNRADLLNDVMTPSCRRIRLEPSSGVKQVLTGIVPTSGVPLYYQANAWVVFMATSSDRIRIALENDTTGEVYDEVLLGSQASNQHSSPITLIANPIATASAGQYYRVVIENKGTVNVNQLYMVWQLASQKASAAYVLPRVDGTTEEHTSVWDSNIDTLRVVSRQALPYKTDTYGQNAALRDIHSDVYLSLTTERLTYAAGASQAAGPKWWGVPRVAFASAMPTTGTWTADDYVQNTAKSELGTTGSKYIIKGWIRMTTGSGNVLNTDWFQDRALTGN